MAVDWQVLNFANTLQRIAAFGVPTSKPINSNHDSGVSVVHYWQQGITNRLMLAERKESGPSFIQVLFWLMRGSALTRKPHEFFFSFLFFLDRPDLMHGMDWKTPPPPRRSSDLVRPVIDESTNAGGLDHRIIRPNRSAFEFSSVLQVFASTGVFPSKKNTLDLHPISPVF